MFMSLGTLLARDQLPHIQQFGVKQVFFVHFSFFTVMMMMMKPLFKCHKILVHYSTNWGHLNKAN